MSEITYRVSEGTAAAIASLVEVRIAREYGLLSIDDQPLEDVETGGRMLAEAGIKFDGGDAYLAFTGDEHGLSSWAYQEVNRLIAQGLAARTCQCSQLPQRGLFRDHEHREICTGHYEIDVPPIDGLLLCGDCHGVEYRARLDA